MARAKTTNDDPTAPRDDDPQCEHGDGRAVVVVHDADGTAHYLCGGHAWARQMEEAS